MAMAASVRRALTSMRDVSRIFASDMSASASHSATIFRCSASCAATPSAASRLTLAVCVMPRASM